MRAPCVRVCRETRKSPLAVLSVCACAQSPGKEEPDPTPGEREENFYVGPPRLVADVPKLEGSNLKVFRDKSTAVAITSAPEVPRVCL